MMRMEFSIFIGLCLIVLGAGCTPAPAPPNVSTPSPNPTSVALLQVTPTRGKSQLPTRTVEYRNCSAKEVRNVSLATEEQVHCSVAFVDFATAASTGETIALTTEQKIELEAEVKKVYQDVFAKNTADVEQKIVAIPIDQVYFYNLYWKQLIYKSELSFVSDGVSYLVPYTYTLDIPQISLQMQHACTA